MEVEFFNDYVCEEDTFEVDLAIDTFDVQGERCGICMDIIVDRGIIDCCLHWFCFECIDSWASIAKFCPLCQNEFQLITCVSVDDTTGGDRMEDSELRDDDWCVEGNNKILSYPAYFIDENAVTCLDGDGCKFRSEAVTYEEFLIHDTSVACDSCDIWYHAFCVDFDPGSANVDSWLCPRCLVREAQKSNFRGAYKTRNQRNVGSGDCHCLVDTFCGNMPVSATDGKETALAVSRIPGEQVVEESIANNLHTPGAQINSEIVKSLLSLDSSSSLNNSLDQGIHQSLSGPTDISVKLHDSIVLSDPNESGSRNRHSQGSSLDATLSGKSISTCLTLEDVKADLAPKVGEKLKNLHHRYIYTTNTS